MRLPPLYCSWTGWLKLYWCRPTLQIYSIRDPLTKHSISILEELYQQTHTLIRTKCRTVLISIRWHLLATKMREEQSASLANLSAVNYGNLPSCFSAFATSLPFVSKSKAGICSIGTFPFLQGHVLHKRLMKGDIYSTLGLGLPLQTQQANKHTQVPTTSSRRQRKVILKQQLWCLFSPQQWIHMVLVRIHCISESQYTYYSMCMWLQRHSGSNRNQILSGLQDLRGNYFTVWYP